MRPLVGAFSSSPFQLCATDQRGAIPDNAAREDQWCSNAADTGVILTEFLDNDERRFLITIDAPSGSAIGTAGG
jgi:hypothetical protein